MYEVFTETHFSSAHRLRNYNGACEFLHGHNWQVKITTRSRELDKIGLSIDFKILKNHMKDVTDRLDHVDLNTIFTEEIGNPSAENIAKYIFDEMDALIKAEDTPAFMYRVDVWETPGNCASYFEEN
ncbi:MAG: 6-carboxytetrahydropterin synthase QueD [Candidatus Marinimicrobia bacterium]|jgi:6-pyruvoyltetrahydropterin/6-carboxytetrahydropterin synthase|nr:6-carboxytetrahydropterin synthase QueD [Candidatus Neomarinimicrobiota bacterium]MBT6218023.1 6-carboxytetrahydropterin synthase QueD [Candidatus Neomarinimicrobiota bacterium]MBT6757659.1 6-carboxytetrahydropterin synthase QueD [Candidatus Jacksonbacteria bacterium]